MMLLKFFRGSAPAVLFATILTALLIWSKSFFLLESSPLVHETGMPLYNLLIGLFGDNLLLEKIAAFVITSASAFYLIHLNTKHIIIKHRSYLLALFYIVLSSAYIPLQYINPALVATPFLILAIDNLLGIYEGKDFLDRLFKAGFLLGIGSLIYLPLASFLILAFIGVIILNNSGARQWFSLLFGFIAPWFLMFSYFFLRYESVEGLTSLISNILTPAVTFSLQDTCFIVFYSFSALLLIFSSLYALRDLSTQKISVRKFYILFAWIIVFSAGVSILTSFSSIEMLYIGAIPVAFIMANYFSFARNRFWPELFLTLLLALSVGCQFIQ